MKKRIRDRVNEAIRHWPVLDRWSFWRTRPADRLQRAFYAQLMAPGDLIFDVGANHGSRSKTFLELNCSVVAFEPQAHCCEYLRRMMSGQTRFQVEQMALGAAPGSAQLYSSQEDTLATLSADWVTANATSGRFGENTWQAASQVEVSTLDLAIARFGLPRFVKVDVEGFELDVVRGLSRPVPGMSLEFAFEGMATTLRCLDHLCELEPATRFRFSSGESMTFSTDAWLSRSEIEQVLNAAGAADPLAWGDVYASVDGLR